MQEKNTNYFRALTGVRAIAAYMVFIHHYNPFTEKRFGKLIYQLTTEFYAGVTMFFVLSGFLIAYRYMDTGNFSFRKYMVNRLARIYPMYFILTLATFIVFSISRSKEEALLLRFFLNISFLHGFFDDFNAYGILQSWTLTVEEMFYLLAPLFFLLLKRNRFYLIILPISFILLGIMLVHLFSRLNIPNLLSSFEFIYERTFFGRCFEFFIGIGLAIFYKKGVVLKRNYHFTYVGLIIIAACLYVLTLLGDGSQYGIQHPLGKLINSIVLPLGGISLFFYGLIKEETFVSKILGSNFFILLGKSSYVFYLIHLGIIASFIQSRIPNAIVIFVMINLISIVVFKYMEEPLNRLVKKWLGGEVF